MFLLEPPPRFAEFVYGVHVIFGFIWCKYHLLLISVSAKGNHHHLKAIITQVYSLSTVHCRVTRYSQRVLGHLTWYSVPANGISFDKNNQAKRLCLSTHIAPGKIFSLSTWWLQQAFWSPFWSIITHMTLKYDLFFKWHQSDPFNVICIIAVLVKASWMHCLLHNQSVNKPGFHGA